MSGELRFARCGHTKQLSSPHWSSHAEHALLQTSINPYNPFATITLQFTILVRILFVCFSVCLFVYLYGHVATMEVVLFNLLVGAPQVWCMLGVSAAGIHLSRG